METHEWFSALAGLLFTTAFIPYIRAILRGVTKPAKASWVIWAALDTITIAGMYVEDAVNGQILGAVIGSWVVVALALKYGTPGWTLVDKLCLGGAVLGIALWGIFESPVLGIVTSLGVGSLGSIPTFISAWKDPSRENKLAWTIFWASCIAVLIAVPRWTLADAAQPVTFFAIETVMMYILYIHGPELADRKAAIE